MSKRVKTMSLVKERRNDHVEVMSQMRKVTKGRMVMVRTLTLKRILLMVISQLMSKRIVRMEQEVFRRQTKLSYQTKSSQAAQAT